MHGILGVPIGRSSHLIRFCFRILHMVQFFAVCYRPCTSFHSFEKKASSLASAIDECSMDAFLSLGSEVPESAGATF